MRRQRPGLKVFKNPGSDFGVRVVQPAAPPGLIPFSLYYDGADNVDCGNDPSVMNLNTGDMTVDVYWRCPALADLANWTYYDLASQGRYVAGQGGWELSLRTNAIPNARFYFRAMDGGPNLREVNQAVVLAEGTWFYVRGHIPPGAGWVGIRLQIDAGVDNAAGYFAPGTGHADNLYLGQRGDGALRLEGNICYCHIWNNDQGALAAIPGTPLAVDANTVARYIHSEGAGPVLGDTSGLGNNGTINGATWSPLVPLGWTL